MTKSTGMLQIEIDGEVQVNLAIGRMQYGLSDLRPVWDGYRDAFLSAESEQFVTQGSAGRGGKWQSLSPDYAAWKAQHYPGAGILVRSSALKDAVLGGAGHIYEPHPTWMAIGADSEVGMYHQRGGGSLPQRKVIDISGRQEEVFGRAAGEALRNLGVMWSANAYRPFALGG